MLELRHSDNNSIYYLLLKKLTPKQQLNIKDSIINTNNRLNRVFPSFNLFSSEFALENRLIDLFSSCFSFHSLNQKTKKAEKHIFINLMKSYFRHL